MITLEEAYRKMTSDNPDRYVYCVNEFEEFYDFVMLKNGEKMTANYFKPWFTAIFKKDGRIEEIDWLDGDKYKYVKSYDGSEIKEMMMERAS